MRKEWGEARQGKARQGKGCWEETALTATSSQFTWHLHSPCCATFFMIARDSYFIKSKAAPNVSCRGFMHISWAAGIGASKATEGQIWCLFVSVFVCVGRLHFIFVLRRFSVSVVLWFFYPLRWKIPKVKWFFNALWNMYVTLKVLRTKQS